ncbi:hypothetical protein [Kitasatospora sp. LaBMicrA B282]|uniref:hypothetical protein n=1 Tax=Kitasatospora sp. LaBMicrA B282 TaxID=3420949 RepID=UPI003D0E17D5
MSPTTGHPDGVEVADAVAALEGWRLRPGVAVTPLREGLHLRGRRSAVTLEGSRALPALWQLLAEALQSGDHTALIDHAPAGSPLRAALNTLIGHLRTHDLLVDAAATPAAPWLRATAPQPAAAAAALAGARIRVQAADPASPLARAALRALHRAGSSPCQVTESGAGVLLLALGASGRLQAVAVRATREGGFVTAPGSPEQATADASALAARLGWGTDEARVPPALTALLAGAATQRLLCAVAGLPDPATEGEDHRVLPGRPAVLLAQAGPLRAEYRSWFGSLALDPDRAAPLPPPVTLAQALHRAGALGDDRLGVLAAAEPGELPQLPVALVSCPAPAGVPPEGVLLAAGARTDLARLDALCAAAELRLGGGAADRPPRVAVGATPEHAWGRALRAAVRSGTGAANRRPASPWSEHPQARHWWRTLGELHLAKPWVAVSCLAPGVHRAVVRVAGQPVGRAVEATAGDAVALAALGAVARAVAGRPAAWSFPSGALAPLAAAGVEPASWEDEGSTTGWLAGLATREPALHLALRRLTGLHAVPLAPDVTDTSPLAAALHACGFTVLAPAGGSR